MRVLGIETSCDETGVAVFEEGRGVLAERLASQVAIHAAFGGVVPELASRDHIAKLLPMVEEVVAAASLELSDLDAIAYTAGPGLIGALLVGGSLASSLAYGLKIPAVPVHHLEGHLLASMLEAEPPEFTVLGTTLDDAAGEAFDKVARLLGLPYPGGPELARLAETGDPERFALPRPLKNQGLDFSFSGLKTAARVAIAAARGPRAELDPTTRADIAASFQAAAVDTLAGKCRRALEATGLERLVIAGGVGANQLLRASLATLGKQIGVRVYYPRPALCTDNGAMIAYAGWCRHTQAASDWPPRIIARPRWPLAELGPVEPT